MNQELVKVDPKDFGLEEAQANDITKGLAQILAERDVLAKQYAEVINLPITEENIPLFKDLRLKIRDNRTKGITPWHAANKEYWLRGGQFVDAVKRKEIVENERMEANLQSNENHFEKLEAEKKEKVKQARMELLAEFEDFNPEFYDLANMEKETFQKLLKDQQDLKEFKRLKAEQEAAEKKAADDKAAAEKAEADRKAEEERKRLEEENAKIKADQEAKDKIRNERNTQLRPYIIFIRDYNWMLGLEEEAYQKELSDIKRAAQDHYEHEAKEAVKEQERLRKEEEEHAKQEAKRKSEADRLAKEKKEAEERAAAAEKELADKKAAEEKAEADRLAKIEAELAMGDKAKTEALCESLAIIKEKYSFKSKKYQALHSQTCDLIDKTINHIKSKL